MQDDWDTTIREAAAILVQTCAPRDSIKHFNSILQEKYSLKLNTIVKNFNATVSSKFKYNSGAQAPMNMIRSSRQFNEEEKIEERKSHFTSYMSESLVMRTIGNSANAYQDVLDNEYEKNSNTSSGADNPLS